MIKNRTAFFLIFLMVVSPIVSAIDHCAGMHEDNAVHQIGSNPADDVLDTHHPAQNNDCHDSGDCALHLCSSHAFIQSVPKFNSVVSTKFQLSSIHTFYDSPSFLAIRPPISIL